MSSHLFIYHEPTQHSIMLTNITSTYTLFLLLILVKKVCFSPRVKFFFIVV